MKLDVVQKSGAWFSYQGSRLGQGRDNAKEFFQTHPDIAQQVEKEVMENISKLSPGAKAAASTGEPSAAAKPVEVPPTTAPVKTPTPSTAKANIDITVDDD